MGFSTNYVSKELLEEGVILIKVQTVFGPFPLSCPKGGPSMSHGQEGEGSAGGAGSPGEWGLEQGLYIQR